MRLVPVVLVACTSAGTYRPPTTVDNGDSGHASFVPDDLYKPSYNRADIDKVLAAERGKEASLAPQAEDGPAVGDLDVRRRFIASLEVCAASGRDCPPRLDEPAWTFEPDSDGKPPLDQALRFDRESWIKLAAELHGRACACRTVACLDSLGAVIDQLETQPTREVQDDDTASQSIVWARECLFRLRGKKPGARPSPLEP